VGASKLLKMERETGLEPATSSLGSWHSTTELLPLAFIFNDFQSQSFSLSTIVPYFQYFQSTLNTPKLAVVRFKFHLPIHYFQYFAECCRAPPS
jgi:hypothetical protein